MNTDFLNTLSGVDKVKNFNQFINENYGDFNTIYKTIKTYIDFNIYK